MSEKTFQYLIIASVIVLIATHGFKRPEPASKSSSFVGYSQSCWQVGDTLHVVTTNGDTIRLDVSRLEEER